MTDETFWNFAQYMAIKLFCSVQNVNKNWKFYWMIWVNEDVKAENNPVCIIVN